MNKQEIEQEIKNIEDYIEIFKAQGLKTFLDKYLAELQAQLAEAEKPKLRHGDYGIRRKQNNRPVLYTDGGCKKLVISGPEMAWPNNDDPLDFDVEILGNIFSDLTAMAEPLEEFEMDVSGGKFTCVICKNGEIQIGINSGNHTHHLYATIEQFAEINLKSRRTEATYIRKAAKE